MIDVLDASSEVDFERHAMNFTPRSVAMGNSMTKDYKLHVKFESGERRGTINGTKLTPMLQQERRHFLACPTHPLVS